MAGADYRSCDVCGGKAFYDSDLSYDTGVKQPDGTWVYPTDRAYKVGGKDQGKYGSALGYVGDWAVICNECSKTHRTAILPIEPPPALLPLLTDYGSVEYMTERDQSVIAERLRARWAAILAAIAK